MAISAEWYTKAVTLDCADGYVPDLYANEGDANGRGIDLAIMDGGKPANTTGMAVYLAWGHEKGGEGLTPFSPVDASKGRWRALYHTSMQRRGTVLARVLVYLNGNSAAITGSRNFRIFVDVDPVDVDVALSDNDFTVFQQAVVDLREALSAFDNASKQQMQNQAKSYESAESARNSSYSTAENTRDSSFAQAEVTRSNNEKDRQSTFATIKSNAEKATTAATTAAGKAEAAAERVKNLELGVIEYQNLSEDCRAQIAASAAGGMSWATPDEIQQAFEQEIIPAIIGGETVTDSLTKQELDWAIETILG